MRRSAPLLADAGPPEENRHVLTIWSHSKLPLSANRSWFRSVGGIGLRVL